LRLWLGRHLSELWLLLVDHRGLLGGNLGILAELLSRLLGVVADRLLLGHHHGLLRLLLVLLVGWLSSYLGQQVCLRYHGLSLGLGLRLRLGCVGHSLLDSLLNWLGLLDRLDLNLRLW
jgi:hypothetical protein